MSLDVAKKVVEVPERYAQSDRSTGCILAEAGFPELRNAVTVEEVEAVLRAEPELIDQWLKRKHDQRLSGGWGIECEGDDFRIQSYSSHDHLIVPNKVRAVAEFIVRYTRFIGEVQTRLGQACQ